MEISNAFRPLDKYKDHDRDARKRKNRIAPAANGHSKPL